MAFFNFLINPNKKHFNQPIDDNDQFNDKMISQYDCGFKGELAKQPNLIAENFAIQYDNSNKVKIENPASKYVENPIDWLKAFHVVKGEVKYDLPLFKTLKLINDTERYADNIRFKKRDNINVSKVLANVDEGNYSVRGVWCDNDYGIISTCIRSIIFRDLELNVIDRLEDMHETVFGHLGHFRNYNFEKLDKSFCLNFFVYASNEVSNYKFNVRKINDAFSQNPLVQLISWQYISEFYAYIKTELTITQYIINNFIGICNRRGYKPEIVDLNNNVMLDENLKVIRFVEHYGMYTGLNIADYYISQPSFNNDNNSKNKIADLINRTRSLILNCWPDPLLELRGEQNCSLRQFMTASLLLVKTGKNQNFLKAVPNYIFYGHDNNNKNSSVGRLISDVLDGKKRNLKYMALISRLMAAQHLVIVDPEFLCLRNTVILNIYSKIQKFMDDQIPLLKHQTKTAAEEIDRNSKRWVTPYELLLSLEDFTTKVIDKVYEQLP